MGKPINEEVVLEHWNDALRLTASIKTVSVTPSAMLRKLGAYRQQNRLYLALGEIGRIERTLFMLDWMESPQLRMECQAGLNKGEARHALARAVFAHAQGRVHDRPHEAQQKRVMALNLVIAAIVYWNTAYIEKAATHLRRERRLPDPTLLRHVSPLGCEHIVLTGDYDWNSGAAERTNARPLNLRAGARRASPVAQPVLCHRATASTPPKWVGRLGQLSTAHAAFAHWWQARPFGIDCRGHLRVHLRCGPMTRKSPQGRPCR